MAEEIYTEQVIATRVNRSGDYPEIALRGTKSNHSFTLRTATGTAGIKADEIYDLTISKAGTEKVADEKSTETAKGKK